jgi:hypothetical protein
MALDEVHREALEIRSAELSPRFWPELHRRLERVDRPRSGWMNWTVPALRLRPLAAAAGLAVGIWAGVWLGDAYVAGSQVATAPEAERELLPYLAILDDVPRGTFAELIVETSFDGESRP